MTCCWRVAHIGLLEHIMVTLLGSYLADHPTQARLHISFFFVIIAASPEGNHNIKQNLSFTKDG